MGKQRTIAVATDTATLAVFDPAAARSYKDHRYHDWWTMWDCAIPAINAGDVAVIDLGNDGLYRIEIIPEGQMGRDHRLEVHLRCPSKTLYIGPGEDIPAAGLEPDKSCTGHFIAVNQDAVTCVFRRADDTTVELAFVTPHGLPVNTFSEPTRLRMDDSC